MVGPETQVGSDAGRGQRGDRREVRQHACAEGAAKRRKPPGAAGVEEHRSAALVSERQAKMDAIPNSLFANLWREGRRQSVEPGDLSRDLAHGHGTICGGLAERRAAADLELVTAVLRQKNFRFDPRLIEGRHELCGKRVASSLRLQRKSRRGTPRCADDLEFLFEGRDDREAGLGLEVCERLLKDRARTALPRCAVELPMSAMTRSNGVGAREDATR
jgi:hypothetical protein